MLCGRMEEGNKLTGNGKRVYIRRSYRRNEKKKERREERERENGLPETTA